MSYFFFLHFLENECEWLANTCECLQMLENDIQTLRLSCKCLISSQRFQWEYCHQTQVVSLGQPKWYKMPHLPLSYIHQFSYDRGKWQHWPSWFLNMLAIVTHRAVVALQQEEQERRQQQKPQCRRHRQRRQRSCWVRKVKTNASKCLQMSYGHYKCLAINKNGLRLLTKMLQKLSQRILGACL